MKVLNTQAGTVLVLGVVVIGAVYIFKGEVSKAVGDVGQAFNPVNDDNIFNQGVLAVGQKITGNSNWSLGGWIYDITHPSTIDITQGG